MSSQAQTGVRGAEHLAVPQCGARRRLISRIQPGWVAGVSQRDLAASE
jgi:hypothetical protein